MKKAVGNNLRQNFLYINSFFSYNVEKGKRVTAKAKKKKINK